MSTSNRPASSRHITPIDGLRAIAVAAVLLYHLGLSWIPGGFLGVDLFFVISGYVITRLILDSIERSSALDFREFYLARLRRLLPALLLLIFTTLPAMALFAPDAVKRFLNDLPYVLTGSNNWRLVAQRTDYFAAIGRPPLLQHTWSLAVEAQFYLLWPAILILALRFFGKKRLAGTSLAISAISGIALFLFSLHLDGASSARISHIYFGTDTHSLGLFLGAALAVSWVPANLSPSISDRAQDFVDFIGVIGLIGLLATFLFIDESHPALYRIAFPLAGIFGCAILTSIVHPASRFAPILKTRPLIWIGERSYGIYLWHWPIFQMSRPGADIAGNLLALNIVRVLLVLGVADISYRYCEYPIRRGVLSNWLRGLKYRTPSIRRRAQTLIATSTIAVVLITGASTALGIVRYHRQSLIKSVPVTSPIVQPMEAQHSTPGLWVTGDSVILGIKTKLGSHFPLALVNARVGRQIGELIDVVKADRGQVKNQIVVLDLGNNNILTKSDVETLFSLLKDQPRIVIVNTAVPRSWRAHNDDIIASVVSEYPQAKLEDWAKISANHPEFFAPDGVHLNDLGGDVYVSAILDALPTKLPDLPVAAEKSAAAHR